MAAIALFTMSSCSSDDAAPSNPNVNPVGEIILPRKIIETIPLIGSNTTIYNYDSQNRLISFATKTGVITTTVTYTNGLITSMTSKDLEGNWMEPSTYTYDNNNRLSAYQSYTPSIFGFPESVDRFEYTYNDNGTITEKWYTGENEPTELNKTSIFTLSEGNIIQAVETDAMGNYTTTYSYDTKNNPYKNIPGYDKIVLLSIRQGTNNVLSETIGASNTTTTYTYNENNYPLTSASIRNGEAATSMQYFYE